MASKEDIKKLRSEFEKLARELKEQIKQLKSENEKQARKWKEQAEADISCDGMIIAINTFFESSPWKEDFKKYFNKRDNYEKMLRSGGRGK
jgi:hypothetical protein